MYVWYKYEPSPAGQAECTECETVPLIWSGSGSDWTEIWENDMIDIHDNAVVKCKCGLFQIKRDDFKKTMLSPVSCGRYARCTVIPVTIQAARPALAVDIIVSNTDPNPSVLVVKRGPRTLPEEYRSRYVLPGGHAENNESLKNAAVRELNEETGLKLQPSDLTFIEIADDPDRDPRKRVISVVYHAVVTEFSFNRQPMDETEISAVHVVPLSQLSHSDMGFDHYEILTRCLKPVSRDQDLKKV